MKNTDDFHYKLKSLHATTKSTHSAVSKEEWDTKEGTGKSMKNALHAQRYAQRYGVPKWTKSQIQYEDKTIYVLS